MTKLEMAIRIFHIVDEAQKKGIDVELHYEKMKLEVDVWSGVEKGLPKLDYQCIVSSEKKLAKAIQTIKKLLQ